VIITTAPYNITQTGAVSGGYVSSDGGSPVTARGVCWSTTTNPTINDNLTIDGAGVGPYGSSLSGLSIGITYYVRAYATNGTGTTYGAEYNFTIPPPTIPIVGTNSVGNIVVTSATGFGQVNSDGAVAIITRGICWSTSPNPTINDSKSENNGGIGPYAESIIGLTAGTTYYVRAFATNSVGTAYGNEISFQTLLPVSMTTNLTTNVTATNANSGGVITSDGGNTVTDRGVCWSTSPNPTYNSNLRTYEGSGTGPFTSALSNLQQGTTYYVRAFGITAAGPGYGQEESFTTTIPVLPTVITNPIYGISSYYAYSSCSITNDGGATIMERGLCWSTSPSPTIINYRNYDSGGIGLIYFTVNSLSSGTTYYVRAYATSIAGTAYGEERTFTTLGTAPTLTTNVISSIAATMAISGGVIANNGGAEISSKGVMWSSANVPYIGSYQGITNDGIGSAPFTSNLSNLSPGTTYYVRAYATNNGETGYGNLYTFTTTYNIPSVATSLVSNIDQTSANGGGNVTNNGGQNVTERGVCWSTSPSPTINDNKLAIGAGNGGFSGSMTGLTLGVTYYVRAYAINSVGTGYGAQVSFTTAVTYATVSTDPINNITATTATGGGNVSSQGGSAVTARGVCWSVNPNPTLFNSKTINGSGTGTFSSNLNNLLPGKTYYVRGYASNSAGTAYGQQQSFTTLTTLPTLTGKPVIYITLNSAQSGGNISNDGGANISERGVCWSTSPNPTIGNSKTIDGTGSGDFTSMPTGLSPLTTYYLRAYATNNVGTAYGSEIVFQTTNFPVAIGQAYQGGIICYIDATGEHGLIVSNTSIGYAQYGCESTTTGAIGIAIGTGASNTGLILQSCNETNTAATICDDYSIIDGGIVFDDWFLPSSDELGTLYTGLYLNNLGGFSNSDYYFKSSSEYSAYSSWYYQILYYNNMYTSAYPTNKSAAFEVRAMRYF
jgi:FlaG/FlaF family flagellin (archaellin)